MSDVVQLTSLRPLVAALRADGYRVIGPTVRDGAIVLAELDSADALPYGWRVELAPGGYRLRRRDDRAAFGRGRQGLRRTAPRPSLWIRSLRMVRLLAAGHRGP